LGQHVALGIQVRGRIDLGLDLFEFTVDLAVCVDGRALAAEEVADGVSPSWLDMLWPGRGRVVLSSTAGR